MQITKEDVQRLLDNPAEDAVLVLVRGSTLVVRADEAEDGAVELARRSDFLERYGQQPSEREREEIAARLTTEISTRGG